MTKHKVLYHKCMYMYWYIFTCKCSIGTGSNKPILVKSPKGINCSLVPISAWYTCEGSTIDHCLYIAFLGRHFFLPLGAWTCNTNPSHSSVLVVVQNFHTDMLLTTASIMQCHRSFLIQHASCFYKHKTLLYAF